MIRLVLLVLLLAVCSAQIILTSNITLSQLYSSMANETTLSSQAVSFLIKTHPQLSYYKVTSITQSLDRGDQDYTDNLFDFHFDLLTAQKRVLAIVTISNTTDQEFVSISPFVLANSSDNSGTLGDFWVSETFPVSTPSATSTITNQGVSSTSLTDLMTSPTKYPSIKKPGPFGGYYPYSDFNDALIQYALDLVAGQHPNILNYQLKEAFYQVVSGINIKLHYKGTDKYTLVTVVINFDLRKRPTIISFSVTCAPSYEYCTTQVAEDYFYAVEGMIIKHPELMTYRVVSVYVEQIPSTVSLKVLITFENKDKQLRTLAQLDVEQNKSTVQSFFTYAQAS